MEHRHPYTDSLGEQPCKAYQFSFWVYHWGAVLE
jgi:hypothetical protein